MNSDCVIFNLQYNIVTQIISKLYNDRWQTIFCTISVCALNRLGSNEWRQFRKSYPYVWNLCHYTLSKPKVNEFNDEAVKTFKNLPFTRHMINFWIQTSSFWIYLQSYVRLFSWMFCFSAHFKRQQYPFNTNSTENNYFTRDSRFHYWVKRVVVSFVQKPFSSNPAELPFPCFLSIQLVLYDQ